MDRWALPKHGTCVGVTRVRNVDQPVSSDFVPLIAPTLLLDIHRDDTCGLYKASISRFPDAANKAGIEPRCVLSTVYE